MPYALSNTLTTQSWLNCMGEKQKKIQCKKICISLVCVCVFLFCSFLLLFFFFSQSSCESQADDLRCGVTLKQQLSGSVARVKHLKPEHELRRGRQLMHGGGVGGCRVGGLSEWRAAGQFTLAYKFRFFLFFSCQKNRVDSSECRSSEHIFFFFWSSRQ